MTNADNESATKRWTLVTAVLGSGLAFIDGTVVNVALPAIQHALNASASEVQWVVEAYVLFLSALLLCGGALGDRLGRKRMFMFGALLFVSASVACAVSPTVLVLILARGVQGIGAAFLIPGSLSLISAAFPKSERGAAIGSWSAFSGITGALGPVIGGLLVDHLSWHWAFLLNVPVGAVLLFICATRVKESTSHHDEGRKPAEPIDILGTALVTTGLAGVIFALVELPARGWSSAAVIGSAAVGAIALVAFYQVEARSKGPMMPLELFRDANFAGSNILTLLLYGALGGALYFLPLNLVQVQGLSATAAGAALLPMIAIMFALSRWAGNLSDKFGPRRPLIIGPSIAGLGFMWFAVASADANYWTTFFPATCLVGLGMSVTAAPLTTTVMNAVEPDLSGTASGINNAVSRTAGLIAIGIFGIVMSWAFNAGLTEALASAHVSEEIRGAIEAQRSKLAGIGLPDGLGKNEREALRLTIASAFVAGFRWVMVLSGVLAFLSAATAWYFIRSKPRS